MAHSNQQRKRIRQDTKRNEANVAGRSRLRSTVKGFEKGFDGGAQQDRATVASTFKAAMSALAKSARKGLISKGAAARKVSRMAARIRANAAS